MICKYLRKPVPQFYYSEIKKHGFQETPINHFWAHVLPLYFTQDRLCGIELENRSLVEEIRNRANINILSIRNGVQGDFSKKVVIISASSWNDITGQLLDYLKVVRAEQEYSGAIYGICAVGSHVSFYSYNFEQEMLESYLDRSNDKRYELQENEQEIDAILAGLANKICEGSLR
ncbi:hypothetical protein H112_00816 [Trichophyton rubrum D6]|uniref:Uncharacterized protein n=3 Tax=Trichophyton TaxID=5550 RepID=A0A178F6N2_TRIRU|nr:hypothetical protein H100_00814 [Trichophyton rubrum MR850]EZF46094.1 hypothetical protein H102_00806 [Trichophyton rubrum CBS 100081]EZF56854.1 hypothetical protein H103_00814 [Trichophyton rubrum CBS 288.86]EZF67539.1 hypothetical protein H104_00798 [Trichophyton rubrum CBS 289.86]EZF78202.1 hypothetical protein H105_00809 [Trichophyton soudanense CBS 452.61]EZF88859.1 hypothetical protein H110_00814 [Trichophyton rubrum MR1448]EZG21204.1 hypothetical protein H107_00864 [Trichophyton rub